MAHNIAIILTFQVLGEAVSRLLVPTLPGPVLGLILCLAALLLWPGLGARLQDTTGAILAHLSLLFVPAGVGVVSHWDTLTADGPALLVAIAGSTIVAIVVGAGVFVAVARITGARP